MRNSCIRLMSSTILAFSAVAIARAEFLAPVPKVRYPKYFVACGCFPTELAYDLLFRSNETVELDKKIYLSRSTDIPERFLDPREFVAGEKAGYRTAEDAERVREELAKQVKTYVEPAEGPECSGYRLKQAIDYQNGKPGKFLEDQVSFVDIYGKDPKAFSTFELISDEAKKKEYKTTKGYLDRCRVVTVLSATSETYTDSIANKEDKEPLPEPQEALDDYFNAPDSGAIQSGAIPEAELEALSHEIVGKLAP